MAWWGLAGIIIPLVVWLLSKRKQEQVEFGSLKFLEESKSPSARSIAPSEWVLFALRTAIIALLTIMMVKPLIHDKRMDERVLIEREVYNDPAFQTVLDGLETSPEVVEPGSLSLLVHRLNATGEQATVYTRNLARDFMNKNDALSRNVEWKVVPFLEGFKANDTSLIANKAFLSSIFANENGIKWSQKPTDLRPESKPIKINVISSQNKSTEAEKLVKIMNAFAEVLPLQFTEDSREYDWLITVDTSVTKGQGRSIVWSNFRGDMKLHKNTEQSYEAQGSLDETDLTSSAFPLDLAHLFLTAKLNLARLDLRVAPVPAVAPIESKKALKKEERKTYWALAMLILLVIERWYSRKFAST